MVDTRLPEGSPPDSPLDVLLRLMHRRWREGLYDAAANLAKIAAPYVHPRAAVRTAERPVGSLTDAELAAEIAALEAVCGPEPGAEQDDGDPDDAGLDRDEAAA